MSARDILIEFDDPSGRAVERSVNEPGALGDALRRLQEEYPHLNFLVDIKAAGRERLSVGLAGQEGMAIRWRDRPLRTLGNPARAGEIAVWDGAGVEMPAREFIPLSPLIPAVEAWFQSDQWPTTVRWLPEE